MHAVRSPAQAFIDALSLEVSAKAIIALHAEAGCIAPGTVISVPYLPGEDDGARLAALRAVRALGFVPMPHVSARRVLSRASLERFIGAAVAEAGVERCLLVAGDLAKPAGPFDDSASIIDTGILERAGISTIAVGGHPEGHPVMSASVCWQVLERKCQNINARGMEALIITQFAFDADIVLAWLAELRRRGVDHPVLLGIPGPASVPRLLRYAAMCGVGASASVLARYGISLGRLIGTAGPDLFVDRLLGGLTAAHGQVSPHLFPFGGVGPALDWAARYRAKAGTTG